MATAVLIVNYRGYDDLDQCLTSLEPFLAAGDEIVVVDYESDRPSLDRVIALHPAIVPIPRRDNLGFAAGVNLAAAASSSPFLLLLNPDAVLEGPVVRSLEDFLEAHSDVGVVGAKVLNADGTVQASARRFPDWTTWFGGRSTWWTARFPGNQLSRRNLVGLDAVVPIDVDWLSGACLMTPRKVFEMVRGFDEGFFLYWEDADYCARVADAGFRRVFVPTVSLRHSAGRSSEHDPDRAIRAFHESAYRLFYKRASTAGRLFAPLVRCALWLRAKIRQVRR